MDKNEKVITEEEKVTPEKKSFAIMRSYVYIRQIIRMQKETDQLQQENRK